MFQWLQQRGAGRANTDKASNKKVDSSYQELKSDQLYNPYTEVLILTGSISNMHQIKLIDEHKFVTASDDGLAIIWDAETGNKLMVLDHKRGDGERCPLLCVLPLQLNDTLDVHVIMTADSLGVLHVWNFNINDYSVRDSLREGEFESRVSEHDGIIKCLVQFNQDLICSGGSDLCLWDKKGKLLSKCSRKGLEEMSSIHSVLKLDNRHFGVVAASDYKSLAVYDINKFTMRDTGEYSLQFVRYLLSAHAENICFLTSVSASFFASGSRDGVVLLWSTNSLAAMKMFNCADSIPKPLAASLNTVPSESPTEIRHILVIAERYLFTAVGCGFKVYDVLTYEDSSGHPKPLAVMTGAHQQPITCMNFLEDRAVLATASQDNTVRLWGSPNRLKRDNDSSVTDSQLSGWFLIEEFLGIELNPQKTRKRNISLPVSPNLLGELHLHSDQVKVVMNLGCHGLVTCSSDNFIIIWKDAEKVREKRDFEMQSFLHQTESYNT